MDILVLGAKVHAITVDDEAYYQKYVDFFAESVSVTSLAATVHYSFVEDLIIDVGDGSASIYDTRNDRPLESYGVFVLRGDGFRHVMDALAVVSGFGAIHGIPVINDYADARDSSKLLQAFKFHQAKVPVARSLYANKALMEHFDHIGEFAFPAIVKAVHGSHGNDNYLAQSFTEFQTIVQQNPDTQFVLQRFVPNNGDIRLLIAGEHNLIIGRSAIDGSHLNNTSQGGQAVLLDSSTLPNGLLDDALVVAKAFSMTIAGVDAIIDSQTGEYYFLEVNAQPQLMSGAFINEKTMLIGQLFSDLLKERS